MYMVDAWVTAWTWIAVSSIKTPEKRQNTRCPLLTNLLPGSLRLLVCEIMCSVDWREVDE